MSLWGEIGSNGAMEQWSNGAMEQWMAIIFELSGQRPLNSISKVERRL
jgi:hypothetical protein